MLCRGNVYKHCAFRFYKILGIEADKITITLSPDRVNTNLYNFILYAFFVQGFNAVYSVSFNLCVFKVHDCKKLILMTVC